MQVTPRKLKIMTVVGTRPEIIKLARVIPELDIYTEQVLVHSGQNYDYELKGVFWKDLELRRPNYELTTAGDTVMETIANILVQLDAVFVREQPDALFFLGDTNSCLAATLVAKRRKVPIFHMEAGYRCFDERVPEETNRRAIDHLSDINLVFTEHARRYLIAEGIARETVLKTGSPMQEVLTHFMSKIQSSDVLERLHVRSGEYFVVSAHREDNVDSAVNFRDLLDTLRALTGGTPQKPVIVSTHPRTRKRLDAAGVTSIPGVQFLKPLGLMDYVRLQMSSYCVVSDSGTLTEESSILNFPAVTIRQSHERPEGMDEGTLIMCGLKPERVLQAIATVTAQHSASQRQFRLVSDYDVDNVSKKVVRIIMSYTDYIHRTVWHRQS